MKIGRQTSNASESAPEDYISRMPEIVITNILDRLPIQEAVRTNILSRKWKLKRTLLSKFRFDCKFFEYLLLKDCGKDYGKIINLLLLPLQGVITTFYLYISYRGKLDDVDISHWLWFLSDKEIKEITLFNYRNTPLKLPSHLFSCLELKHLQLFNCCLHPPPSFCGFPNLLRLRLSKVRFQNYECGKLLSQCPLLETLVFRNEEPNCEVKLVDITKLENLKTLYLSLCLLDDMTLINVSSIRHHLCLLPKLEELTLDFWQCEFLAETDDINRISTVFPSLKSLDLSNIDLSCDVMVSFAFGIIFSSPNLQTLKISATYKNSAPPPAICSSELERNIVRLLHLQNVMLESIKGLENEVYLIQSIFACSPMLKKIDVDLDSSCDGDKERYELASKLLKLHRASPEAEIDFYRV